MKRALPQPAALPRLELLRFIKGVFVRPKVNRKQVTDSVFSLACQRCAGFTSRSQEHKIKDY